MHEKKRRKLLEEGREETDGDRSEVGWHAAAALRQIKFLWLP